MRNTPRARRFAAPVAVAALAILQVATVSCVSSASRVSLPLDCDAGAPYTIAVYESYELSDPSYQAPWYGAADFTGGGTITNAIPPLTTIPATRIEGNGRCGSQY